MVNVEIAQRRTLAAVLALMGVAEHEIASREPDGDARRAVVAQEVDDARHAERPVHERDAVVPVAKWQAPPHVELVGFAALVEGERGAAVEENNGSLDGRDLNGR